MFLNYLFSLMFMYVFCRHRYSPVATPSGLKSQKRTTATATLYKACINSWGFYICNF